MGVSMASCPLLQLEEGVACILWPQQPPHTLNSEELLRGGGGQTLHRATKPRGDRFLHSQTVQRPLSHSCNGNFSAGL